MVVIALIDVTASGSASDFASATSSKGQQALEI